MSNYQAVAVKRPAVYQGPEKLMPCGKMLAGLPLGDAVVFNSADGHGTLLLH
jgi:hypothetical protein